MYIYMDTDTHIYIIGIYYKKTSSKILDAPEKVTAKARILFSACLHVFYLCLKTRTFITHIVYSCYLIHAI